ncbi:MAG TPA: sigma 54-interacting transcriptional regulator [Haliangium sp.]|nr:sigma 54-interacting transcriptional regulator [Haliangium sp.]
MSERAPLPWNELLELRAVARVREILGRRWRLGLGHADGRTRAVTPPQRPGSRSLPTLCSAIQGCEPGARACQATAHETLQRLLDGAGDAQPIVITCHAGLRELVVPIAVDGERVGALLCGGFAPALDADATLHVADRRTAPLALEEPLYVAARAGHPRLGEADVELVGELLSLAAGEIAGHVRERGLGPRRPGQDAPGVRARYADIIGASPPMQQLYDLLDRVVPSDATVLIQGDNGTGKELVARAIHELSPRRKRRFVVTNCSAFNDNLLDSELFGHARGAFTGAIGDKQGLFEVADQGTFFLDEIGDMSPALQVKVLRVLQEGTFTRVGDTEMRKVDVRIIAATNRDLRAMVAAGTFREDLYYRINVINLHIPPLRERPGDLEILVAHFLGKHRRGMAPTKKLARACLERLLAYTWPGNVRELENEIERLVVFAGDDVLIQEDLLSRRIREPEPARTVAPSDTGHSLPRAVDELERRMIVESLQRNDWNKTRAAAELEISRRNLIRLVQKYGLEAGRAL